MNEQELKTRTKQFGLRVTKLVGALPNDTVGRALGNQLVRSGTAVGAECVCVAAVRIRFTGMPVAFAAALFYALHPIAGVAVNYLCARDLLLMQLFLAAALWLHYAGKAAFLHTDIDTDLLLILGGLLSCKGRLLGLKVLLRGLGILSGKAWLRRE